MDLLGVACSLYLRYTYLFATVGQTENTWLICTNTLCKSSVNIITTLLLLRVSGLTTSVTPTQPNRSPTGFLPTIPPEIHFPQDEIPDYDQNNLHRPINALPPTIPGLPPGLPLPPNYGEENKKLSVISLQADSPTSIKLLFGLPPVLVGLRGSVDLRYTDEP